VKKYRKRPVIVEAVQFTGNNVDIIKEWVSKKELDTVKTYPESSSLFIYTLEGIMEARVDDWIIKGINGEFYPCKPDIFKNTYDKYELIKVKGGGWR